MSLTPKELAESLCCDAPPSQRSVESVIEQAIADEREECAKIADAQAFSYAHLGIEGPELNSAKIADEIRKRGHE